MKVSLENRRVTRETEPGCVAFHVLVDPSDRTKITVCEIYKDEQAFKAHLNSVHFLHLRATVGQWVEVRDRQVLEVAG